MVHERYLEYKPSEIEIPNPDYQEENARQIKLIKESDNDDDKFDLILGMRDLKEFKNSWDRETFMEWIAESFDYKITCVEFGEHKYKRTGHDVFEVTVSFDDSKKATYEENLETVKQEAIMNCL